VTDGTDDCHRCGRQVTDEDEREILEYPERIDDFEFILCMLCSAELDLWLNTPPPKVGSS